MEIINNKICLCMIVKDEASVIARCLESVKPLLSYWVIVDTGSTDGTQDVIIDAMKGISGKLYQRPWKNFSYNRSEALALSREHGEYSLVIDSDDTLDYAENLVIEKLDADYYLFDIIDGDYKYPRAQLFKNELKWIYKGVVHEYPYADMVRSSGNLPFVIRRGNDGDRRKDSEIFLRDAKAIESALETENDEELVNRYYFYLAQSYRDAGSYVLAIKNYEKRATMGGWAEEVYCSLLQAAKLKERLDFDQEEVIKSYKKAIESLPYRAEAHYYGSRYCRFKKEYATGYEIAKKGLEVKKPSNSLFGEPWVYDIGLPDEFSIHAYWIGRFDESLDFCLRVLETGIFQGEEHFRVLRNMRFSLLQLMGKMNQA